LSNYLSSQMGLTTITYSNSLKFKLIIIENSYLLNLYLFSKKKKSFQFVSVPPYPRVREKLLFMPLKNNFFKNKKKKKKRKRKKKKRSLVTKTFPRQENALPQWLSLHGIHTIRAFFVSFSHQSVFKTKRKDPALKLC
jgi:hypothetical protein